MTVRVAINGFGRIGRLVLRGILESRRNDVQVVGINDLGSVEMNAHLLKYDSIHGTFAADVTADSDTIDAGSGPIRVSAERDPAKLPWKDLGVDVALECTGLFTNRDSAAKHLDAGAKKVLISAPAKEVDKTIVYGVNHDSLEAGDTVVSNASCTTNCLAPVADVLNKLVGLEKGFMTTIHSYTGDQRPLDTLHSDPRRARACAVSMIPTSTGAAQAVGLVLPELKGKLDGTSIRVPTPNVSVVDLVAQENTPTTAAAVNAAFTAAADGPLSGILQVVTDPLVSIDFKGNPHSSIVDASYTSVMDGDFIKLLSWYDNEWGYSSRCVDLVKFLVDKGL